MQLSKKLGWLVVLAWGMAAADALAIDARLACGNAVEVANLPVDCPISVTGFPQNTQDYVRIFADPAFPREGPVLTIDPSYLVGDPQGAVERTIEMRIAKWSTITYGPDCPPDGCREGTQPGTYATEIVIRHVSPAGTASEVRLPLTVVVKPEGDPDPDLTPRITSFDLPAQLPVNTPTTWTLTFEDADGDVNELDMEKSVSGSWIAVDVYSLNVRGQTQGTISSTISCSQDGLVEYRAILRDAAGHSSDPYRFSFGCVEVAAGPFVVKILPEQGPGWVETAEGLIIAVSADSEFKLEDIRGIRTSDHGAEIRMGPRDSTVRACVILIDAQGHSSEPREYGYQCVSDTAPPPPTGGTQTLAQALDANGNDLLDDAEIRQAVQYWILDAPV